MSCFQFIRQQVEQASSTIANEAAKASSLLDQLQALAARVPQAWIGDDANEFAADFARRIVPAMVELIAAIGGININIGKGTNIVDTTDTSCTGLASNLADTFSGIF